MSNAILGWGTTLQGAQGAEIVSIKGPSSAADRIEVTHFGTPTKYKEFLVGMVDPGEFSFTANYTAGAYNGLKTLQVNGTVTGFSLSFKDGGGCSFDGYVKDVSLSGTPTGKVDMEVSIIITGAIT
jgi:hypothetical protein